MVQSSRFSAGVSLGPVGLVFVTAVPPRMLVDDVADADEALGCGQPLVLRGPTLSTLDRLERQMLGLRREDGGLDQLVLDTERKRRGSRLDAQRPRLASTGGYSCLRSGIEWDCLRSVINGCFASSAVRAMRMSTPEPLAEIAARCGYADQAHLSRDFKEFSTLTPRQVHGAPSTAHNHLSARVLGQRR